LHIDCPCDACRGEGCPACFGTGQATFTECPLSLVPHDVWAACEMSDFAAEGAWPVAGGTLDQTDSFLAAHRFVQSLTARLLAPPKKK